MRAKTNVLVGWKQRMKARAIGSTKDNFPQEHTSATIYCTGKRRDKRFWAKEENLVSDAASRTYNELANVTDEWFASQKSLFKHKPAKVEKDRQKKNLAPLPMDASPGQQQNTPVCCVRHTSLFKTNTRRTTLLQTGCSWMPANNMTWSLRRARRSKKTYALFKNNCTENMKSAHQLHKMKNRTQQFVFRAER